MIYAVMPTVEDATRAVEKVKCAQLFDTKVDVRLYFERGSLDLNGPQVELGWYAKSRSGIENIRLRSPLLSSPVDIFRPIQEGGFCLPCDCE